MKKLLVMCYPGWGARGDVQYNQQNDKVVLAPDEFNKIFLEEQIDFDVVSLFPKAKMKPLFRSNIVTKELAEVKLAEYPFIWHMFRDPTQPEVLEKLKGVDFTGHTVFNDVAKLKHLFKPNYYAVLAKYGMAPKVVPSTGQFRSTDWEFDRYGTAVSKDRKFMSCQTFNNNRGDYPERERLPRIIYEFEDNKSTDTGYRSFFRIGYCLGQCVPGWIYYSDEYIFKSGTCKKKHEYALDAKYHLDIKRAMDEIGVDIGHLEGLIVNDRLIIFDINPYPTAGGGTLTGITKQCVAIIKAKLNE